MTDEKDKHAVDLFKHVDSKIEKTRDEVFQLKEVELTLKDMLTHLTKRVDFGVSKTGQENKDTLAKHSVILNDIEHSLKENQKWREGYERHIDGRFEGIQKYIQDAITPVGDTVKKIYGLFALLIIVTLGGAILLLAFRVIAKSLGQYLGIGG